MAAKSSVELLPVQKEALPNRKAMISGAEQVMAGKQMISNELMGRSHVVREINSDDTIQIVFLSDLHIGHEASDLAAIKGRIDYILNTPNVFCVGLGDLIEGLNPEYFGTNIIQTPLDFTEQIMYFRTKFLEELVKSGKLLALVSDYDGHTGWSHKKVGLNAYHFLTAGLDIPLVRNGGQLVIKQPSHETVLDLYHTPPRGSTVLNPTQGLHNASRLKKGGPHIAAGGHIHKHGSSVSVDIKGTEDIALQEGTNKSTNPALPRDRFFLGKNPDGQAHGPGNALTVRTRKSGTAQFIPTTTTAQAEMVVNASRLLDSAESQHVTQELLEEINQRNGFPVIRFDVRNSRRDDNPEYDETIPSSENNGEAKPAVPSAAQYQALRYRIETALPFLIAFGSHFLIGSSSAGTQRFEQMRHVFLDQILQNPHAAVLFMRGMLDEGVSARADREDVVGSLRDQVMPLAEQNKILGWMLSGGDIRDARWARTVGESGPFQPGTYLSQETHAPLFNNKSVVEILLGRYRGSLKNYRILALDKLGRSGSSITQFNGHRRMTQDFPEEVDIAAGGHLQRAGWLQVENPFSKNSPVETLVDLGWFAKVNTLGRGNRQDGSPGGQSVILTPDKKLVLPQASMSDALEMQMMLTLWYGLQQTHSVDSVLQQKPKRGKKKS